MYVHTFSGKFKVFDLPWSVHRHYEARVMWIWALCMLGTMAWGCNERFFSVWDENSLIPPCCTHDLGDGNGKMFFTSCIVHGFNIVNEFWNGYGCQYQRTIGFALVLIFRRIMTLILNTPCNDVPSRLLNTFFVWLQNMNYVKKSTARYNVIYAFKPLKKPA